MGDFDYLTGLHTIRYLHSKYTSYKNAHPNARVVAIDFAKLKYINDNFGHEVGDICLKKFAEFSKELFTNALLSRRSGDEFIFLIDLDNQALESTLVSLQRKIIETHTLDDIPIIFGFNCGVVPFNKNFKETLHKADITMYQAKAQEEIIRYFDETIETEMQRKQQFIEHIDILLKTNDAHYAMQPTFDLEGKKVKLIEFYRRDQDGNTIFNNEQFHTLEAYHRFNKIDLQTIEQLFGYLTHHQTNATYMINIHYETLLARELDFIAFLKEMLEKNNIRPSQIIFCVYVSNFHDNLEKLIHILTDMNQLGFKLCLNQFNLADMNTIFIILDTISVAYIKISKESLKQAMNKNKNHSLALHIFKLLLTLNVTLIFTNIETKEEKDFISTVDKNCLAKGFIYALEQDLYQL